MQSLRTRLALFALLAFVALPSARGADLREPETAKKKAVILKFVRDTSKSPSSLGSNFVNCNPQFRRCVAIIYAVAPRAAIGGQPAKNCSVFIDSPVVFTPKSMRVVWRIERADPDADDGFYRFATGKRGIDIDANPYEGEFLGPDFEQFAIEPQPSMDRYKWEAIKKTPDTVFSGPIAPLPINLGRRYDINIERGKPDAAGIWRWTPCDPGDPIIINEG